MHSIDRRCASRFAPLAPALFALAACGGGGDDAHSVPPAPDLSGVWAGTWQGLDPVAGPVTGTWEAALMQGDSTVAGNATLLGDVDCMDGVVAGGADTNDVVSGTYDRWPCALNTWTLTAINVDANIAAGTWGQPGTGASGSMTGRRIAVPGGPRLLFANPPSGRAGAIVTLVGTGFGATAANNVVNFGLPTATLLSAGATNLVARVPAAATIGPVAVTSPTGIALSPRAFDPAPRSPTMIEADSIYTDTLFAQALATSPDGRKLYVASRGFGAVPGSIAVVDTARRQLIGRPTVVAAPATPTALVASPDGKRVYVAAGSAGVLVLEAALGSVVDTITVAAGSVALDNPHGIAMSPDGRLLYVTDNREGGSLSIIDLATKAVDSVTMGSTEIPLGVAMHPDGTKIYLAVADALQSGSDSVRVLAAGTGQTLQTLPAGARPTGLAVVPDGSRLYVTNQLATTVDVFDTATGSSAGSIAAGLAPTGIAASPDGTRVLIALKGEGSVSAWVVGGGESGRVSLGSLSTIGVAVAPNGRSAYVSSPEMASVFEIGGSQTLTLSRSGTGIGTITSSPAGIDCGTACLASFDTGATVTLTAVAGEGSAFSHWSGAADCSDGVVAMSSPVSCSATFNALQPPSPPPPGGGCFIATAAWGSPMATEVASLRRFRDRVLMHSAAGRAFVRAYYAWSPPLATFIGERESLRSATRVALWPVVQAVRHPAAALGIVLLMLAAPLLGGIRKRS